MRFGERRGKTIAEAREEILKLVSTRYNPKYCFVQLAQLKKSS